MPAPPQTNAASSNTGLLQSEFQLGLACFPIAQRPRSGSQGEDVTGLVGQFQALQKLRHPCLCRYFEVLVGRDHIVFLVSEHSSLTLSALTSSHPTGFNEELVARFACQIVDGLCYLNSNGLVHGRLGGETVVVAEDGVLKLSGHAYDFLTWHGKLVDFPIRPHGNYMAPELTCAGERENAQLDTLSCKPDVWSLGILVLELAHGPWSISPDAINNIAEDEAAETRLIVQAATLCAVRQFVATASREHSALSVTVLLSDGAAAFAQAAGAELPLRTGVPEGDVALERAERAYRQWLCGSSSARNDQHLRDFWATCLVAHPGQRPSPADLASHPAISAAAALANSNSSTRNLRWTNSPALQSEKAVSKLHTEGSEIQTCLQYLRKLDVQDEHIFYWWNLAGGDPFTALAERHLLRPPPPAFRFPLFVRDAGADNERGIRTEMQSTMDESSHGYGQDTNGSKEMLRQPRSLWGPPGAYRPQAASIDLRGLCSAVAAAESVGMNSVRSLQPASLYDRQRHFGYQWLRVHQFQRLLISLPKSKQELFCEATEDVPPLLRAQVWAALLGADPESDRGCWTPFYEQLLASPAVASAGEKKRRAFQSLVNHELLTHAEARRQLERLVHTILQANPCLTQVDGVGALAAPLVAVYSSNEPAAFLTLQRILHGFLWLFYAPESGIHRRQCMHLFSALLRFVDPQLELHLQTVGMQPEVYAGAWFSTWFAQLLPLPQLLMLWDALLLRPPQFSLFVGVCLMHLFRKTLLGMDEVSCMSTFLASCAQLVDVAILLQASIALFHAVPASVTLPLYPRHSAGEALLSSPGSGGVSAVDQAWREEPVQKTIDEDSDRGVDAHFSAACEQMRQRAMEQWRQCEWWRQRAASMLTPPIITVDDLISFRSRCFVLDCRPVEEFLDGHFQASHHVRDPEEGDLSSNVPVEVLRMGCTPGQGDSALNSCDGEEAFDARFPWLFAFDPGAGGSPELRVRLVVVVGGRDFGVGFAERLLCAGVRHAVCLLGGLSALRADAPRYMVKGPE